MSFITLKCRHQSVVSGSRLVHQFEFTTGHVLDVIAIARDHPLGRVGTPQECAEAIDYLVRAEWTTGAALAVDGGLSLGLSNY